MKNEKNEYYAPCVKDYRSVDNNAAIKEWFEDTEPSEKPTHGHVLSTKKADAIFSAFVNRLRVDVLKNSVLAWVRGTPFPRKAGYKQPLSEKEPDES